MDEGDTLTAAAMSEGAASAWQQQGLAGPQARCLSVRAECLTELGHREEALAAAEAAASLAQDLAEARGRPSDGPPSDSSPSDGPPSDGPRLAIDVARPS